MTERERLIEMIQSAVGGCARHWAEIIADYLLEHGACYIPYKRDQEIWVINKGYIHRCIVRDVVTYTRGRHLIRLDDTKDQCELDVEADILDEHCYPTYEEASNALLQKLREAFGKHDKT